MSMQNADGMRWLRAAAVMAVLLLAGCATPQRSAAYFPPAPTSYFTVPVRPGDSLSEIAYRYQVEQDDLLAMNDIRDPNTVLAGGAMRVPAYGHLRDTRDASASPPRPRGETSNSARSTAEVASRQNGVGDIPIPLPKPEPPGQTVARQSSWWDWIAPTAAEKPAPETATSSVSNAKFLWPVSGRVLSPFGASTGGERNDGINISAARGAPVRAAGNGTVTYVGNELKGYGNLVLIRHDNGYVTAYAHSDTVSVQRGDRVARGQIIAYAGATGDVDQPQVHFELRLGTKPVDPKPYLVASN